MTRRGWLHAVGCLLLASPVQAADPPHTGHATLACGTARLQARTTSVAHVPPDDGLAWTAQEIMLHGPGGSSRRLRIQGIDEPPMPADGQGLPVIVSSWQCLHGSRGEVIELWLTCNRPDPGAACGGQREWERLIDTDGMPLDAGYAPQDARYEALSRHLGIPVDGIKLQDATGD